MAESPSTPVCPLSYSLVHLIAVKPPKEPEGFTVRFSRAPKPPKPVPFTLHSLDQQPSNDEALSSSSNPPLPCMVCRYGSPHPDLPALNGGVCHATSFLTANTATARPPPCTRASPERESASQFNGFLVSLAESFFAGQEPVVVLAGLPPSHTFSSRALGSLLPVAAARTSSIVLQPHQHGVVTRIILQLFKLLSASGHGDRAVAQSLRLSIYATAGGHTRTVVLPPTNVDSPSAAFECLAAAMEAFVASPFGPATAPGPSPAPAAAAGSAHGGPNGGGSNPPKVHGAAEQGPLDPTYASFVYSISRRTTGESSRDCSLAVLDTGLRHGASLAGMLAELAASNGDAMPVPPPSAPLGEVFMTVCSPRRCSFVRMYLLISVCLPGNAPLVVNSGILEQGTLDALAAIGVQTAPALAVIACADIGSPPATSPSSDAALILSPLSRFSGASVLTLPATSSVNDSFASNTSVDSNASNVLLSPRLPTPVAPCLGISDGTGTVSVADATAGLAALSALLLRAADALFRVALVNNGQTPAQPLVGSAIGSPSANRTPFVMSPMHGTNTVEVPNGGDLLSSALAKAAQEDRSVLRARAATSPSSPRTRLGGDLVDDLLSAKIQALPLSVSFTQSEGPGGLELPTPPITPRDGNDDVLFPNWVKGNSESPDARAHRQPRPDKQGHSPSLSRSIWLRVREVASSLRLTAAQHLSHSDRYLLSVSRPRSRSRSRCPPQTIADDVKNVVTDSDSEGGELSSIAEQGAGSLWMPVASLVSGHSVACALGVGGVIHCLPGTASTALLVKCFTTLPRLVDVGCVRILCNDTRPALYVPIVRSFVQNVRILIKEELNCSRTAMAVPAQASGTVLFLVIPSIADNVASLLQQCRETAATWWPDREVCLVIDASLLCTSEAVGTASIADVVLHPTTGIIMLSSTLSQTEMFCEACGRDQDGVYARDDSAHVSLIHRLLQDDRRVQSAAAVVKYFVTRNIAACVSGYTVLVTMSPSAEDVLREACGSDPVQANNRTFALKIVDGIHSLMASLAASPMITIGTRLEDDLTSTEQASRSILLVIGLEEPVAIGASTLSYLEKTCQPQEAMCDNSMTIV